VREFLHVRDGVLRRSVRTAAEVLQDEVVEPE